MQYTAVSLLPSRTLRNCIRETGHTFSERDILSILYRYAPAHNERMELLARFAEQASEEYAAHARRLIAWDEACVARFSAPTEGFIYEIAIKDSPDSPEECALCPDFQTAVKAIGHYYDAYADLDIRSAATSSYTIRKRPLLSSDAPWPEGVDDKCRIDAEGRILLVSDSAEWDGCPEEVTCVDCTAFCPYGDVRYPFTVVPGDILRYTEDHYPGAAVKYGICPYGTAEYDRDLWEDLYLYPLDSDAVRRADVSDEALLSAHEHIPVPLCERVTREDLPDEMRTDCMIFWQKFCETIQSADS